MKKALQYKIHDFLDWDTEKTLMPDKWSELEENCKDHIYIFNCCLLQDSMCETIVRLGFGSCGFTE